jgi:inner membrane protein involved in colicin E2 resistance
MSDKNINIELTTNFYKQLVLVCSIGVSSILGWGYLGNLIEEKMDTKMAQYIEMANDTKIKVDINTKLIAVNTAHVQINSFCLENFIQYYNRTHNKEFILPSQLKIETEKKTDANNKEN